MVTGNDEGLAAPTDGVATSAPAAMSARLATEANKTSLI